MSAPDETAVHSAVFSFLRGLGSEAKKRTVVVAFSGGPDSTALLWALTRGARQLGDAGRAPPRLVAAHLDHGLDPGSADRAARARPLARLLGLDDDDFRSERLPEQAGDADDGVEDWARRRRYEFLRRVAVEESARLVVTAHHADDQAETVALRLLFGSGLRGLAGVRPERGLGDGVRLRRPLLHVRRRDVEAALDAARRELPDLAPLHDPTNDDARQPRALVRHHLLPRLDAESPGAGEAMSRVADAARRARRRLDAWLDRRLAPASVPSSVFDFLLPPREWVSLSAYLALPPELRRQALARLHARIGSPLPPPAPAVSELERQLGVRETDSAEIGVDCGDGLRWRVRTQTPPALVLERRISPRPFTYTFDTPGAVHVPEIFLSLHCRPCEPDALQPWMLRGEVLRTGLSLPAGSMPVATVRSRRPGDRLRPLGAGGSRKLKDLLIDRKVPRGVRDRLPLLFLDGILAWVPGVTVDESFRLDADDASRRVWVAEIRRRPANESSGEVS